MAALSYGVVIPQPAKRCPVHIYIFYEYIFYMCVCVVFVVPRAESRVWRLTDRLERETRFVRIGVVVF